MANPREYGKVGLYPGLRAQKRRDHARAYRLEWTLKRAALEFPWGHPSGWNGGSCCLQCRRLLDKAQTAARAKPNGSHILPDECCDACGRWPIDQALIEKGHLGVQSDPRWAVERIKIADMRTTFAPGEKIMPSRREAVNG